MAERMDRRKFLQGAGTLGLAGALQGCALGKPGMPRPGKRPNIVLLMADDQGFGDTGFHGHPVLKTPNLDALAGEGIRLDRFYSAAPVCSPTRGSCLTGRHPYRYGIFFANVGHMRKQEITLAEALKPLGYRTGHFGKWHLGTLTTKMKDANRGRPGRTKDYSPPWENGFDVCFSTESKVPTWDPMKRPKGWRDRRWWNPIPMGAPWVPFGTHYWTGPDRTVPMEKLGGNDSRLVMDRALAFIEEAAREKAPFLAVIWFHAPHWPVAAGKPFRDLYKGRTPFEQNYFGAITALDEQVGRLRKRLRELGVEEDTLLWYASDNGPEGTRGPGRRHGVGSAGPFRGRKRSLYEGGIRVPGILYWPKGLGKPRITRLPCSTSDIYPTVLDLLDLRPEGQPRPIDGISLLPLFRKGEELRRRPMGFQSRKQLALVDDRYKLYSKNKGKSWELYDLQADPSESKDLAEERPKVVRAMSALLLDWKASCERSLAGKDYSRPTKKTKKSVSPRRPAGELP